MFVTVPLSPVPTNVPVAAGKVSVTFPDDGLLLTGRQKERLLEIVGPQAHDARTGVLTFSNFMFQTFNLITLSQILMCF